MAPVGLEAAHHNRVEVARLDGDAGGEALRIENFQQGGE
jgi:hypothetical protein